MNSLTSGMIDGGDLFAMAMAALATIFFLPIARLGGARAPLVWPFAVTATAAACYAFAAAAVDLSPPPLNRWAGITVLGVLGAGLAVGVHRSTERLAALFSATAKGAGKAVFALIFLMALVQFAIVVMRHVFGLNFIAMQESVTYFHGAVFLLAAGYALLTNDHVRVDIFYAAASPKRQALINLAGTYLFLFPFCLVTLWAAAPYVANAWAVREGSTEASGVQAVFLLKSLIPAFATLLAFAGFAEAARAVAILRGEASNAPHTETEAAAH